MVATTAPTEADVAVPAGDPASAPEPGVAHELHLYIVVRTTTASEGRNVPRVADDPKWTDPGLLVMGSLAEGPKHGYAMVQDVMETTGVRLGPGTLYGAIARLEARGLIEAVDGGDSRRRPYTLTMRGVEVLEQQLAGMQRFAGLGRRRLTRLSPVLRGAS